MRLLFDTHALLWFLSGDPRLPTRWHTLNPKRDECWFSHAGFWEIGIKLSLEKLQLGLPYEALGREITARGIRFLPIETVHCYELMRLPWIHRDPFDRMMIAQARTEHMTLLSGDTWLASYDVHWLWQ